MLISFHYTETLLNKFYESINLKESILSNDLKASKNQIHKSIHNDDKLQGLNCVIGSFNTCHTLEAPFNFFVLLPFMEFRQHPLKAAISFVNSLSNFQVIHTYH